MIDRKFYGIPNDVNVNNVTLLQIAIVWPE